MRNILVLVFALTLAPSAFAETVTLETLYETLVRDRLPGDCKVTEVRLLTQGPPSGQKALALKIEGTMPQDGGEKFKATDVLFYQDGDVVRDSDTGIYTFYITRNYSKRTWRGSNTFYDRLALRFSADGKSVIYTEVGTMIRKTEPVSGVPYWAEVSLLRCGGAF